MAIEHFDVLIVGAGLSGIGAGHHLQVRCPDRSYAILEGRERLGGTWDLFRYPGVRSDSDMYTLGYSFRPWTDAKAIADGPAILKYVQDTARDHGIDKRIRYGHRVKRAAWSTPEAQWTVEIEHGESNEPLRLSCNFLFMCSGYYRYDVGYTPGFACIENFKGRVVHPQHWTPDIAHANKRVVVIGSGATAVTLVPELAKTAAHVTMLQRSPTYVVARPSQDGIANGLRRVLPGKLAYSLARWKQVLLTMYFYNIARGKPEKFKAGVMKGVRAQLGPDYDVATHFTPRYNPWDQRLCLVPDSDLFVSLRDGTASIVTDTIETFTPGGLRLTSGQELAADVVVTATGLKMILLGGVEVLVDGARVDLSRSMSYKGMMFSGIPNLAAAFGYTNASWTLKADLTSAYVCRLLQHMDRHNVQICTPTKAAEVAEAPFLNFTSGYVQRASDILPRQGTTKPWKLHQNYARDLVAMRYGRVDDGTMVFTRKERERAVPEPVHA